MCHVYPCVKPKIKIYGTWQVCLLLQQHEIAWKNRWLTVLLQTAMIAMENTQFHTADCTVSSLLAPGRLEYACWCRPSLETGKHEYCSGSLVDPWSDLESHLHWVLVQSCAPRTATALQICDSKLDTESTQQIPAPTFMSQLQSHFGIWSPGKLLGSFKQAVRKYLIKLCLVRACESSWATKQYHSHTNQLGQARLLAQK